MSRNLLCPSESVGDTEVCALSVNIPKDRLKFQFWFWCQLYWMSERTKDHIFFDFTTKSAVKSMKRGKQNSVLWILLSLYVMTFCNEGANMWSFVSSVFRLWYTYYCLSMVVSVMAETRFVVLVSFLVKFGSDNFSYGWNWNAVSGFSRPINTAMFLGW